jgi:hypothetical protein
VLAGRYRLQDLLAAGGTVTVTTAVAPPGHRHGYEHGKGDGNDS